MPKLRSAQKRLRQSLKRQARNIIKRESYKTLKRTIRKSLAKKKNEAQLSELVNKFYKAVDKAVKKGAIHPNKASREKSRLLGLVKKGGAAISTKKRSRSKAAKKIAKAKARKGVQKTKSSRKSK